MEYKKGKAKKTNVDDLQLMAQVICLEEMFCHKITKAYLYYGESHSRKKVELTDNLRQQVTDNFKEMHKLFLQKHTPKVKRTKACNFCSLKEVCVPKLNNPPSVLDYIKRHLQEN